MPKVGTRMLLQHNDEKYIHQEEIAVVNVYALKNIFKLCEVKLEKLDGQSQQDI